METPFGIQPDHISLLFVQGFVNDDDDDDEILGRVTLELTRPTLSPSSVRYKCSLCF